MIRWLLAFIFLLLIQTTYASDGVECPVNRQDRVGNGTGVQCVWASLETIARYIGETRLYDLTDKYKNVSDPGQVAQVLNSRGVPFEQATSKEEARVLIMKGMQNGMPVLFGAGRVHAMVIVNYDPTCNRACYVDNSNLGAGVITKTIPEFERMWDGWVVLLHPGYVPPKSYHAPIYMVYLE